MQGVAAEPFAVEGHGQLARAGPGALNRDRLQGVVDDVPLEQLTDRHLALSRGRVHALVECLQPDRAMDTAASSESSPASTSRRKWVR